MIEKASCSGGAGDCKYREEHELMLVEEIMRAIEQYNRDKLADPCPVCLRDTMLAVAALLHIQSGRANDRTGHAERAEAEFGEAAVGRLRDVIDAASSIQNTSKH
jgi:hypothetical protein